MKINATAIEIARLLLENEIRILRREKEATAQQQVHTTMPQHALDAAPQTVPEVIQCQQN